MKFNNNPKKSFYHINRDLHKAMTDDLALYRFHKKIIENPANLVKKTGQVISRVYANN